MKKPNRHKHKKSKEEELDVARMQRILAGIDTAPASPEDTLPDFPPPRETSLPELSQKSRLILNAQLKARAFSDAREIGSGIFNRAPEFFQKQIMHLIAVIDSISRGHPKMRNKLIWEIVAGVIHAARVWLRDTKLSDKVGESHESTLSDAR